MNGILTNGNLDRDENLAEVYDSEKNNQLKNSEKGKGHWKQSLASNSEASVCYSRSPFLLTPYNICRMEDECANEYCRWYRSRQTVKS